MKTLFDQTELSGISMKNRIIRAATWENMADDKGHLTSRLEQVYRDLADGGASVLITGYSFVIEEEQPNPGMMGIYSDRFIDEYKIFTDMVHNRGSKIVLQTAYGGSQTKYRPVGREIWAPSAVKQLLYDVIPKEMTPGDIQTLINAFAEAGLRAKKSGFDGTQIHAAHGYLLNQFLTPYYNRRTDSYGGNLDNRARIIYEIYEQTRQRVGNKYPIWIKINCSDFMEDGFTFDECKTVCRALDEMGIDAIEISGGQATRDPLATPIRSEIDMPEKESYFREYASQIAELVDAPVILVGGNRSISVMENILHHTSIEYFSLCRALLSEPDLVNRWKDGYDGDIQCIACKKCWHKEGNVCIFNRATAMKP